MVFRWRRPLLLTYYDNYRYGTSLYSTTAGDVEKKYRDTLSRTYLRSDRADLGLSTFSGSQLHGGLPASGGGGESGIATEGSKSKCGPDLYAPMSFGYGRSYYNNLRASSEPRTMKKSSSSETKKSSSDAKKSSSYYSSLQESSQDIQKSSSSSMLNKISKSSADYDKSVTTTTTTERWVPLSHYLYPSTQSYYYYTEPTTQTTSDLYYMDDVKIKKTLARDTKRDIINALDLSTSYTTEKTDIGKFDYGFWTEKCREIQGHLDHVNRWVSDAESKIKNDLVGARNKMHSELSEVSTLVDDTTKYNEELQRVIRRQAKQISELHSQHDEINRHLSEVNENLEKSRTRCQGLQSELANVQQGLEMASKRKETVKTVNVSEWIL